MTRPFRVIVGTDVEGYVQFDASLAEQHRRESDITDCPIEQGANISDHVRPKPIIVQMLGIVSQTPIPFDISVPSITRVEDARTKILKWRDKGVMLNLFTFREYYAQMVIQAIEEDIDFTNANDFEATLVFKQISTASLQFVQLPVATTTASATVNNGTQPAPVTSSQSFLSALVNGAK
jgi:hypothetical protein